MSQVFAHDHPRFPDPYANHVFSAQDIGSFLDGDESCFALGLSCALPSEKELSIVEQQLQSVDGLSFFDPNYRLASEHHVRPLKVPNNHWAQHEEYKLEPSYDAYSSPPTTSRSPCISDDLSEDSFSPRSTASSQSDMASWHYANSFAPYGVSTGGYPENVSLSHIQGLPDEVPDVSAEPHDYSSYITSDHPYLNGLPNTAIDEPPSFLGVQAPQPDEINEPVRRRKRAEESSPASVAEDDSEEDSDYKPSSRRTAGAKRGRRRGSTSNVNLAAALSKTRGHRRTASDKTGLKRKANVRKPKKADPHRPFPCPFALYGCGSTFTSKNEWKRHVSTQHVKLGFWRCDMCPVSSDPGNPIYNDFNRKDLFTQHVRRMHVHEIMGDAAAPDASSDSKGATIPDDIMAKQQTRCFHHLRSHPTRSGCLFCAHVFEGHGSWEQRMEHLGVHFEKEKKNPKLSLETSRWREDVELREWFEQEGLIERDNKGGWRIGDGQPRRPDDFLAV